ncbi:MAG: THUMP domain-containing protein [Bacteroidota bacterium]
MKWIAKTLFGLEEVLAEELTELGVREVEPLNRAVAFEGDDISMFRVNLESRLTLKVLKPLFEYQALNIDEYYHALYKHAWTREFGRAKTFAVQVTTSSKVFYHSKFMILKTKDAIVDHFRRHLGFRPNIDKDNPDIRIEIHIRRNHVSVYLDTTGKSLHYRGYRTEKHAAPLNEVLAAGMIKLSGWDQQTPFYDGMCGSGTLLTEAAWMATNRPPALDREEFAFMKLPRFKKFDWDHTVRQAEKRIKPLEVEIQGSDVEGYAMKISGQHLKNAGVEGVYPLLDAENWFS